MISEPSEQSGLKKIRLGLLIYPRFQLALIAFNGAVVSIGFLTILFGYHFFLTSLHRRGVDSGLADSHYYFIFLEKEAVHFYRIMAAAYVGTLLLGSLATVVISQKLAGPIVRLRSFFRDLTESPANPSKFISFRDGDFFSDLPELINSALAKLKSKN